MVDDPKLRELKKQTRMMAEQQAGQAAAGFGCLGTLLVVGFTGYFAPSWLDSLPWWYGIALFFGMAVLGYGIAYWDYTKDK